MIYVKPTLAEFAKLATETYKRFAEDLNETAKIAECENKLRALVDYKTSEIIKYYCAENAKYSPVSYKAYLETACEDILKGEKPENVVESLKKELIYQRSD